MIKRILNLIITIAILYIAYQYYIKRTANDDIDTFNECDHMHLNNMRAEVTD
ncbi:transcriptional activator RinB [Staphylococcus delphini]|uniref:transcriptional activator RinB n=1 Tax=Staphylococcus delphini TaxID=53344 RepID=UPI003741EF26